MRNDVLRQRIRLLPKAGSWTCRLFDLPGKVQLNSETADQSSFQLLTVQDESDHVIFSLNSDSSFSTEWMEAQLADELLSIGRGPARIYADGKETVNMLRNFCLEAGIALGLDQVPPHIPACEMVQLLSAAPDTPVIHDAFCEVLLQLRDEELLRMPRDLVEALITMEKKGAVPHTLGGRIRRLFGIVPCSD